MDDLWLGIVINLGVAVGLGFLVRQWSRKWRMREVDFVGLLVVVVLVWYIARMWDHPWQARWLPYSNLIVLGNLLPMFTAILAGLSCRRLRGRPRQCGAVVLLLAIVGGASQVRPLWGQPPRCDQNWDGNVCLQTTPHTCSAASAATVLRQCGVETSEAEMAELCLTRAGTHWMGLYRGLRKKLDPSWQIEVFESQDLETLGQVTPSMPAILTVELPDELPTAWEYRLESGWLPGVSHSVVCLGANRYGDWRIADPATGLEYWTTNDLLMLWRGYGVRVIRGRTKFLANTNLDVAN